MRSCFPDAGARRNRSADAVQVAILLAVSIAIAPQLQFRPQMLTFATNERAPRGSLARYNYRGSAAVWLAIPMTRALGLTSMEVFIIGLTALGTFSVVRWHRIFLEGRRFAPWGCCSLTIATSHRIPATLATPYGSAPGEPSRTAMTNPRTREIIAT